jgi:hypothetical protein
MERCRGGQMKLAAHEQDLVGGWVASEDGQIEDPVAARIDLLVAHHLKELGTDSSGWDLLLRDPTDGRLWELTYPESQCSGGGPPRLTCIGTDRARDKYGSIF